MHSLSAIQRKNALATAKAIQARRASGKFVVVHYAGATILTFDVHAERPTDVKPHEFATHTEVLEPLGQADAALVRGRDQSEDYVGASHA